MTEEYQTQEELNDIDTQVDILPAGRLDIERLTNLHGVFKWLALILGLFFIGIYVQTGITQLLFVGIAIAFGGILLFFSHSQIKKGNKDLADTLMLISVAIGFIVSEFQLSGFTLPDVLSWAIVTATYWIVSRPRHNFRWVIVSLSTAIAFLLAQTEIFPRQPYADIGLNIQFIGITTIVIAIAFVLWQAYLFLQKGTIAIRLLIGFVAATLIPLLFTSGINGVLTASQNQTKSAELLNLLNNTTTNELSHWVEGVELALSNSISQAQSNEFNDFVYNRTEITDADDIYTQITQSLNESLQANPFVKNYYLTDQVALISIATDKGLEGSSIDALLWSQLNQTKFSLKMPEFDTRDFGNTAIAATPIFFEDTFIGMVIADININALNTLLESISGFANIQGLNLLLINSDSEIIATGNPLTELLIGQSIQTDAAVAVIDDQATGNGSYDNDNGENVVGSFAWNPTLNAGLIVEQTTRDIFSGFQQNILVTIFLTVLGGLVALSLGWTNTQNISTPLKTLKEYSQKLLIDEPTQPPIFDLNDEISELAITITGLDDKLKQSAANLESAVSERTIELERRARYLEATTEVAQSAGQFYNMDDLLVPITHLISEQFGFYHVGIFLLDNAKEFAVLRAANSEGGWRMLSRGHRLRVGEEGIVGYVTSAQQPRVIQQVGTDEVYFNNPDLPLTRAEMALPLVAGGQLLGALDVQSVDENAFTEDDIAVLQVLANQVALAIFNARLFEQLQSSLEAERRVFGELSREAWSELLHGRTGLSIRVDNNGYQLIDEPLEAESKQAVNEKKTIQTAQGSDEGYSLSVPIKVHGNVVIGLIETNKPADSGPWLTQEIAIMESIGEQLGIALENARLFDETQRLAYRERVAAGVSSKVWSSSDIETILQTTVEELGRALNASEGRIRLQFGDDEDELVANR